MEALVLAGLKVKLMLPFPETRVVADTWRHRWFGWHRGRRGHSAGRGAGDECTVMGAACRSLCGGGVQLPCAERGLAAKLIHPSSHRTLRLQTDTGRPNSDFSPWRQVLGSGRMLPCSPASRLSCPEVSSPAAVTFSMLMIALRSVRCSGGRKVSLVKRTNASEGHRRKMRPQISRGVDLICGLVPRSDDIALWCLRTQAPCTPESHLAE